MQHVIRGFRPFGGQHCVTTSIRQIFHHNGHELSEEMLFGLGSGLSFNYSEFEDLNYPLICGRCRTGNLEESLACNLGVSIDINRTTDPREAWEAIRDLIQADVPVMIYVDMHALAYLGMPGDVHFGGHTVVVFGFDEEENIAYVSDRDVGGFRATLDPDEKSAGVHRVPLADLQTARSSKHQPFPPENRWLTFDLNGMWPVERHVIFEAIRETCTGMVCTPAENMGLRGIQSFAREVCGWSSLDERSLRMACFNAYIMINAAGGTGGGAFRRMYGNFLKQGAAITGRDELDQYGREYITLSEWWDDTADTLQAIGNTSRVGRLDEVSECLMQIHRKEAALIKQLSDLVGS
jgi:hypothetical protein